MKSFSLFILSACAILPHLISAYEIHIDGCDNISLLLASSCLSQQRTVECNRECSGDPLTQCTPRCGHRLSARENTRPPHELLSRDPDGLTVEFINSCARHLGEIRRGNVPVAAGHFPVYTFVCETHLAGRQVKHVFTSFPTTTNTRSVTGAVSNTTGTVTSKGGGKRWYEAWADGIEMEWGRHDRRRLRKM